MESLIHCQPTDTNSGQSRITRQVLDVFRRQGQRAECSPPIACARWLRRVEDGFGDLPLVFDREVHNSGLLNDAASGFIGRGHHKVREAGPALAYPEYNAVRSKPGTAAALRGRRRSSNCQATANYLIGPSAENLLRPAPGGSSRSTCALPPLYRRLRTRIRCWPESGISRASTIAALAGSVCRPRRTACSCPDSSCDP